MTSAHDINSVVAEYGMGTVEKLFRLFSISSLAFRIDVSLLIALLIKTVSKKQELIIDQDSARSA